MGCRLDGVVRTVEDEAYEYAGIEVAKKWQDHTSSKSLNDSRKLIRALRDMLRRLHGRVNNRKDVVHKLQVVGLLNQGLRLQVLRMCHPHGYVCLLMRGEDHRVPSIASEIVDLLRLIVHLVQVKVYLE